MKTKKKFVIDRKTWLRGEGSEFSLLLRKTDHRQCCLGFYLNQCGGISKKDLVGTESPVEFNNVLNETERWLLRNENMLYNSVDCYDLMKINDNADLIPELREKEIADIFAKHGVEVEFK